MQESRKFALVVSLSAAIALGAVVQRGPMQHRQHRIGAVDDSVVSTIIDYVVLASRILIPPG